ncbi:MAG: arsenite methyltransferase [Myxococcota bacterium]|jgi:arsenite methyltransferase
MYYKTIDPNCLNHPQASQENSNMKSASLVPLTISLIALVAFTSGCSTLGKMELGRVVTSGRDGWQLPDRVVESLAIKPGDRVAEIGAGNGYWLPWLAEAVGQNGRVYAVEVTDELVEQLTARVEREPLRNVVVVRGQLDDPSLPAGKIDVAITSLTYHHIEDRPAYFKRLQASLASEGRVVHIDGRPDLPIPLRWLQSSGHSSVPEEMENEMNDAGYERTEGFDFLAMETIQVFVPIKRVADRKP